MPISYTTPLDHDFAPAVFENESFIAEAKFSGEALPLPIALEQTNGVISRLDTLVVMDALLWKKRSQRYLERLVKAMLWTYGGHRLYIGGSNELAEYIRSVYSPTGPANFDYHFMHLVYGKPLEVIACELDEVPLAFDSKVAFELSNKGCRVGFDLGATDVKVAALEDGKTVFSESYPWYPVEQSDPAYHYNFIRDVIKQAASHLPQLDAIGGSAAGVYVNNQPRVASLFKGIPQEEYHRVHVLFEELAKEFSVPITVINDGEMAAVAGAMNLGEKGVLGLALGSSLASGFVTQKGTLTGYLNELAFVPIDLNPEAVADSWSGVRGTGSNYLSQECVFRLTQQAGIPLPEGTGKDVQLKAIQQKLEEGEIAARQIWETMGVYLGFAIAQYSHFYDFKHVILMGRVTSGEGGKILLQQAQTILSQQFPQLAARIHLHLPEEADRRVGQAIAAAQLQTVKR